MTIVLSFLFWKLANNGICLGVLCYYGSASNIQSEHIQFSFFAVWQKSVFANLHICKLCIFATLLHSIPIPSPTTERSSFAGKDLKGSVLTLQTGKDFLIHSPRKDWWKFRTPPKSSPVCRSIWKLLIWLGFTIKGWISHKLTKKSKRYVCLAFAVLIMISNNQRPNHLH